jgi:hypothetical protein
MNNSFKLGGVDLKKITSGGLLIATIAIATAIYLQQHNATAPSSSTATAQLTFPFSKYPETGEHIKEAIAAGEPSTCTIDQGRRRAPQGIA